MIDDAHDNIDGVPQQPSKPEPMFDPDGQWPSGWWIVPAVLLGALFWACVLFLIF